MEYLKIHNWDKWQSYRKDRGQPPWIKIHRRVMRNPEWVSLADEERGQLVAIWLLAADHNGVIPASPDIIQKLCFMSKKPNLNKFAELGFIENNGRHDGVMMASSGCQDVTPEAEAEAEAEKNRIEETIVNRENSVDTCPHQEIIELYHETLPLCRKVKIWDEKRQKKLRARWNEDKDRQSLEWWKIYFRNVSLCFWFTGRNDRNWFPNLEWLVEKQHMINVLEKKYYEGDR